MPQRLIERTSTEHVDEHLRLRFGLRFWRYIHFYVCMYV